MSARPVGSAGSIGPRWPATVNLLAVMPEVFMRTSWLFPPRTTELQFDELWAFVAKKEAQCDRSDPHDDHKGDYWDHVAFDPEHRLVVEVVPGARTIENTEALVTQARRRTGGRLMNLMTSDAYPAYGQPSAMPTARRSRHPVPASRAGPSGRPRWFPRA